MVWIQKYKTEVLKRHARNVYFILEKKDEWYMQECLEPATGIQYTIHIQYTIYSTLYTVHYLYTVNFCERI